MIKVSLIAKTDEIPLNLVSHAAKTCYTSKVPEIGKLIDIENNLFKTGHHTTFQHNFFTFNIDGLSVSSTTFGLHLTHQFYNTDQRSGRFSKMYTGQNCQEIKEYILKYWNDKNIDKVMNFIKNGIKIYQENIEEATEIAENFIKEERPNANEEYIKLNAPKIAQEQMRVFISTISPTALDYTVNLSTISAMYRSAWNPELRNIMEQIKEIILKQYPDLSYIFEKNTVRENDWIPEMNFDNLEIKTHPICKVLNISLDENANLNLLTRDSVDLRYFIPENMDNNISTIKTNIEVSIATMGQDQRHRTIKRSIPKITGSFYLPPILQKIKLQETALKFLQEYVDLYNEIDPTLLLAIAPYGLMVQYSKLSDLNGLMHEQEKRLCWSAQEEIYHLSKSLYDYLNENNYAELAKKLTPACYKKCCIEGKRYCGRDINKLKTDKSIPDRKI